MDFIKNYLFKKSQKRLNSLFSLIVGLILGITYGAGVLISEAKELNRKEIFFIATFLMICHSIIEDSLLFVIFGANFWILVIIRLLWAIIIAYFLTLIYRRVYERD